MRQYLRFVVEHALTAPHESLKEMTVGMALYAVKGNFDPRNTAAVRVDATRLRVKLLEYYSSDGAADPVVIDLPKGSYSPIVREAKSHDASPDRDGNRLAESSVVVLPFSNLSPDPDSYFRDGLSEEIIQPAVNEVGVVGRRHPVWGEIVIAFVVLRPGFQATEDELLTFARERLADYKVPESIIFRDELPKGSTGNILRRALGHEECALATRI